MYCKKCGKFIGTDDDLCYECKSAELMEQRPVAPQATPQPVPQPVPVYAQSAPQPVQEGSTMTGFGKALAGTIVGYVAFCFSIVALAMGGGGGATSGFFAFWLLPTAGGVLSLVFGILSIKTFKREAAAGRKKPIPALVLGICSTVLGGLTLLFCMYALVAAFAYVEPIYYEEYYYY